MLYNNFMYVILSFLSFCLFYAIHKGNFFDKLYIYMYLLLVYNDFDRRDLMFIGQFKVMNDISKFTNGAIRYCDRIEKDKCYRTYKNLFK